MFQDKLRLSPTRDFAPNQTANNFFFFSSILLKNNGLMVSMYSLMINCLQYIFVFAHSHI